MGYRYRKSFKLGPFRINLSKSGVGWSVGNKYARYTRKANGGTRITTTLPGTGISLQNRGANFSLDPASDNCLAGGKKSYHTIIPGFLLKDGQAVGPFGVMGAFMQPQGQAEVIINTLDYHMNPQEALDAPRIQ